MANKVFGTIKQTNKIELRVQTVQWAGSERYDIRSYNGNYGIKGVTLSKDEMLKLKDILEKLFDGEAEEAVEVKEVSTPAVAILPQNKQTDDEKVIHALTSIPVNDGNYPLNTATIEQLQKAIKYMEENPDGQKTRLARCKGRLHKLESKEIKPLLAKTKVLKSKKVVPIKAAEDVKDNEPPVEEQKAPIIKFPKKDETQIVKLPKSDKHYTYEDVKEKLDKERRVFKGDRDSEYVIDGILEACVSDQDLLDNVMRPEKSYVGAFQYFARKAKEGHCIMIGNNCGIMDADTALKYALDYFNSEDPKPKTTNVDAKKSSKVKSFTRKKGDANDTETKAKSDTEVYDECAGDN